MRKLKVLYLCGHTVTRMEIDDDLQTFYQMIGNGCHSIDIVRRYVNGKSYRIICDDEGRLKENMLTVISITGAYPIAGRVIVTGVENAEGELTDLTDKDYVNLRKRTILGLLMVD